MNLLEHFGIKDVIDILLVAYFLYQTYKLMKISGATALFSGIMSFIFIWILVSQILEMRLLGAILDKFMSFGIIVLIVLFQDEIRQFLSEFGSHGGLRFISKIFIKKEMKMNKDKSYIMSIVMACMNMAKTKTGALIALKGTTSLDPYIETGELINGEVSTRLIENIFFKNSPLHDGAVIIDGDKIIAAACILPVAQSHNIPKELGLRHRSALGLSQETDAKIIIVSEERGSISVAYKGRFTLDVTGEELQRILSQEE